MPTTAYVTIDNRHLVDENSTCTIGDQTVPIPARTETLGTAAPHRIWEAIGTLGFEVSGDYYDTLRHVPGGCTVAVVEI